MEQVCASPTKVAARPFKRFVDGAYCDFWVQMAVPHCDALIAHSEEISNQGVKAGIWNPWVVMQLRVEAVGRHNANTHVFSNRRA